MAASLKALAEDKDNKDVKKKTIFQANPLVVQEKPGFNKRNYADPETEQQIEAFAQSYAAGTFVPAWVVWVNEDGSIIVLEGHLRRRGSHRAIERGASIPFVDMVPFTGTWAEAIQLMLLSQEGLKFKPLEFALGILDLKAEGLTNPEIAASVKRTPARVEQLLLLATAGDEVHELVRSGKVEAEAAILAIRDHRENAAAFLTGKLQEVKDQGGKKVTRSALKGPSLPPKVLTTVIGSLESVVSRLSAPARIKLAEYESQTPEQLKGKTIEIDVESLLELVRAQGEVVEVKAKRDAAAAANKLADSQQTLEIDSEAGGSAAVPETATLSAEQLQALRVYGGAVDRAGVQVRAIVATYTQKDAAKLVGVPLSKIRAMWAETSNPKEVDAAKASPEQVLVATSLNGADFAVRS
ncbi:hypothetical protein [Pseudomonas amygdali]|uniref:hypothetical protein n=1 Tax=Pseudomonas amygdali TaxID=47877 RepID=UPI0006E4F67D|nr:hypothetical protein [Pseudomonas amygdali]KPY55713.1 hypothetical protein ALO93_200115 [Pseudomonas amygdali pv. sesami]